MSKALTIPEEEFPADLPALGYLNGLQSIVFACACALSTEDSRHASSSGFGLGASSCGSFTKRFKDEYADFERGVRRKYPSIASPGIGYTAETERELAKQGFYSDPAIGLSYQGLPDDVAREYLQPIKSVFEQAGIRCAWTKGARFPNDEPFLCLSIDTHDPAFLEKIKPVYLKHYPEFKGENLARVATEYRGGGRHIKGLLHFLYQLGLEIGAEKAFLGKTIAPGVAARDDFEDIQGQLDYDLDFIRRPIAAFGEHLTSQEKADVIVRMAAALARVDIRQEKPTSRLGR